METLVLEDQISQDFLIHSGNLITTSHYADVVEERMIAKKCGYPVCNNQLNQIPTQRYKISLKTNRVYDITERKCFCSNFCFKASKYFESQISDSPVWTRIGESLKTFNLLESESSSTKYRAGVGEVLLGTDDHDSFRENQIDNEEQVIESKINKLKTVDCNQDLQETKSMTTISESETRDAKDLPTIEVSSLSLSALPTQERLKSIADKRHFISTKEMRQDTRKETYRRDAIVQSVQAVFREWCTQSTLEWFGLCVNTEGQSSFSEEMVKDSDSITVRAARFFQPAISTEDYSDSDSETETSLKTAQEDIIIKEKKSTDEHKVCILPPIDSKSQRTIRRRIVLDKLFRTLPDFLCEVKLTVGEISRDLTELVHTFSLSSTNVALKPPQWKIVALAVVVMLKKKNSSVSQAMESYCNEFDALLGRLAISRQDIDKVLSPFTCTTLHSVRGEDFQAKSSGKKNDIVVKTREDYGDMEELD